VVRGFIVTEMLEYIREKLLDQLKAAIPVGHLGRPDDLARIAQVLESDYAAVTACVYAAVVIPQCSLTPPPTGRGC
jgi:NAD(P)-dependent dehydrogenase (short-subunit alcohol dehydrogenase family)